MAKDEGAGAGAGAVKVRREGEEEDELGENLVLDEILETWIVSSFLRTIISTTTSATGIPSFSIQPICFHPSALLFPLLVGSSTLRESLETPRESSTSELDMCTIVGPYITAIPSPPLPCIFSLARKCMADDARDADLQ